MEAQYLLQEIFLTIILDSNTSMRQSFMGCLLSKKRISRSNPLFLTVILIVGVVEQLSHHNNRCMML